MRPSRLKASEGPRVLRDVATFSGFSGFQLLLPSLGLTTASSRSPVH